MYQRKPTVYILTVLLLIVCSSQANSLNDDRRIHGVVVNENKTPLEGVLIIGKGKNAKDTVRTNSRGLFEIANISGHSYKIGIEKDGYFPQEYQVLDLKEDVDIDTITLHAADYKLQGAINRQLT